MDLKPPKYLQSPPLCPAAAAEPVFFGGDNPFLAGDAFADPLCKLNLRETSDFVRALPAASANAISAQRRERESSARPRLEVAPCTPGRPVFGFSGGGNLSRKSVPSKWDDAEKWLISSSSSCRASPAHPAKPAKQIDALAGEKPRRSAAAGAGFHEKASPEDILKDKFTDMVEPVFLAAAAQHRDVGTEMTPLGSSTTSRCPTPFKVSSPARHNTPADRSGPIAPPPKSGADISEIKECHFANFASVASNWSSREEEEEEISKSLRHFEISGAGRTSMAEFRAAAWEDEEKSKICVRYQREEAKIQAWVNLQSAKAEAESRKLEVKVQRMRAKLEEKLMRKMAVVSRKSEEWRMAAQLQHAQEMLKAAEQAAKMKSLQDGRGSLAGDRACGCIPLHPPPHHVHRR